MRAWHSFILNFVTYYFFKDATGEILGVYRKTHIPDGMSYAEKFYFTPGDSGFKVWDTAYCLEQFSKMHYKHALESLFRQKYMV